MVVMSMLKEILDKIKQTDDEIDALDSALLRGELSGHEMIVRQNLILERKQLYHDFVKELPNHTLEELNESHRYGISLKIL